MTSLRVVQGTVVDAHFINTAFEAELSASSAADPQTPVRVSKLSKQIRLVGGVIRIGAATWWGTPSIPISCSSPVA